MRYSALMPAVRITLAHLLISPATNVAIAAGVSQDRLGSPAQRAAALTCRIGEARRSSRGSAARRSPPACPSAQRGRSSRSPRSRQEVRHRRHVGQPDERLRGGHRERAQLAQLDVAAAMREPRRTCVCTWPLKQVGPRRRLTAIRHVDQFDPGQQLEQLGRRHAAVRDAGRREIDRAWLGLRVDEEFRHGLRRTDG